MPAADQKSGPEDTLTSRQIGRSGAGSGEPHFELTSGATCDPPAGEAAPDPHIPHALYRADTAVGKLRVVQRADLHLMEVGKRQAGQEGRMHPRYPNSRERDQLGVTVGSFVGILHWRSGFTGRIGSATRRTESDPGRGTPLTSETSLDGSPKRHREPDAVLTVLIRLLSGQEHRPESMLRDIASSHRRGGERLSPPRLSSPLEACWATTTRHMEAFQHQN